MNWKAVCLLDDIDPNTGVCALVNGHQVALFRLAQGDQLFAIGNYDPVGGANVLSRGLIAQLGEVTSVASPLYKHHFCLSTGVCQEDSNLRVPTYPVRLRDNRVEVVA
ncbi:nitrite reductase small subunit NirD [Aestuariirhabdus litorea]|uniref:Nitrite reductase (NAD(P)H) small subunit n=1 Tax=Aestuariirhabdus litorea TaxID=2528527 RepID=A0A3P3VNQ5_9GAMM|nr:nitrite reductase small subunit NirD [Aestuariirhabdus litorea]RRJ83977.1 nitrite reductase (NAD(P)H) small subunit [Aestuariirhabdus litorea]RWW97197.1 nitrite reductase small subunit NirD [Endozoicomonadaceae bacterium GTF-13]